MMGDAARRELQGRRGDSGTVFFSLWKTNLCGPHVGFGLLFCVFFFFRLFKNILLNKYFVALEINYNNLILLFLVLLYFDYLNIYF